MIYTILYANKEKGYGLYERSLDFPQALTGDVEAICHRLSDGSFSDEEPSFRFSALGKQDRYLLCVVFRQPHGNADQHRAHSIVVNYLMDAQDADQLLSDGYLYKIFSWEREARPLLGPQPQLPTYQSWQEALGAPSGQAAELAAFLEKVEGQLEPAAKHALLRGALYGICAGNALQEPGQILIAQSRREVCALWLYWTLSCIPEGLRKQVSFHTGVLSAQEGRGVYLAFCPDVALEQMQSSGYSGAAKGFHSYLQNGRFSDNDLTQTNRELTEQLVRLDMPLRQWLSHLMGTGSSPQQFQRLVPIAAAYQRDGITPALLRSFLEVGSESILLELMASNALSPEILGHLMYAAAKLKNRPLAGAAARQLEAQNALAVYYDQIGRLSAKEQGVCQLGQQDSVEPPNQTPRQRKKRIIHPSNALPQVLAWLCLLLLIFGAAAVVISGLSWLHQADILYIQVSTNALGYLLRMLACAVLGLASGVALSHIGRRGRN